MSYPFIYNDGGQSKTKRPKEKNTCVIRALAIAENRQFEEVYTQIKNEGRTYGKRFNFKAFIEGNKNYEKLSFPAIKGYKRMNPKTFSEQFKEGIYIVKTAKHVFCFIDGVAQDTTQAESNRCIYTAWKRIL